MSTGLGSTLTDDQKTYELPTDKSLPNPAVFDPTPTHPRKGTQGAIDTLLVYTEDDRRGPIPLKRLTITNNSTITMYPVLRDGNEAETSAGSGVGLYDPWDPTKQEYRGYIGYKVTENGSTKYFFGLKSGESITIRVPLVFWNAARIGLVTDGRYLTPNLTAAPPESNPYNYDPNAMKIITSAVNPDIGDEGDYTGNGVVMWYRAALKAPALDAPDQLAEWTIRDPYLGTKTITDRLNEVNAKINDSEKVTLINYDVSYVDNMFLPVAMAALDVPLPDGAGTNPRIYPPNPAYGWIGAINDPKDLVTKIQSFTTGDAKKHNTLLGTYFGGFGWPIYNIPPDPIGGVKIPAGQNVFAQSPLASVITSYDPFNKHFMLTTGGTDPTFINIGSEGTTSTGNKVYLSTPGALVPEDSDPEKRKKIDLLLAEFQKAQTDKTQILIVGRPADGYTNPIPDNTHVTGVFPATDQSGPYVTIDQKLQGPLNGTFDFFRPVTDYASTAMYNIWYSWVKYYLDHLPAYTEYTNIINGSVDQDGAYLTFDADRPALIPGMVVAGSGLNGAGNETTPVTIVKVISNRKVMLSQLATATFANFSGQYTITKPIPLPTMDVGHPALQPTSFTMDFNTQDSDKNDPTVKAGQARAPLKFAETVYVIMNAMAQIPKSDDPKVKTPHILELMNNVIGGNMGKIFGGSDPVSERRRFSTDGLGLSAVIRDMIKSVLRGVTDFTKFTDTTLWYPEPSKGHGNKDFNVFNLDPFVWFVHDVLKFSGYGFSLDDDTADVGAGNATKLQMTVAGVKGLPNPNEWTIQAVYGPVGPVDAKWDPSQTRAYGLDIKGATNKAPITITSSAKQNLIDGDQVVISNVQGNTAANNGGNNPAFWIVANSIPASKTFDIVGSDGTASGTYVADTGKWTGLPLHFLTVDAHSVYWKLKGTDRDAGFQGAFVTSQQISNKLGTVWIQQLGDDGKNSNLQAELAINTNLLDADNNPLGPGTYKILFRGQLPK